MAGRAGPWILAVVVAAAALFALATGGGPADPVGRGTTAPAFVLPALDGGDVSLASLRGEVVLVSFWATWCKPCEEEMPALQRLHATLGDRGFRLLAVSVDEPGAPVAGFRDRLGLTFPILLDPEREVAARYQAERYPESLLVDRSGVVVERYVGAKPWDAPAYVSRIQRLLASGN